VPRCLVLGGGGREHAIAQALVDSPSRPEVIVAPGNAGIEGIAETISLDPSDRDRVVTLARERAVDLVIVGPEAPLVAGVGDALRAAGVPVLGPNRAAAELEGSKAFAKAAMRDANVPTARWSVFDEAGGAIRFAKELGGAAVVKADGLAAGKGVVVAGSLEESETAIRSMLGGQFGAAGHRVVVEERLEGEELSVIALCAGERIVLLAPSQDHKRVFDGDRGPNTGGMGAYSPAPRGTEALMREVEARCLRPIVELMAAKKADFSGVLYAGLMLTQSGPKVLEYNVRFGDPETEAILVRLDEDAYELFLATATGSLPDRAARFSSDAAVTVVLAAEGYPGKATKGDPIEGLERAAQIEGVNVFHAGTRRAGDRIVTDGGRILAVTALGATLPEAVDRVYRAAAEIRWRGMHYRKDIAHRALPRS
jgi:phosphoribosylamine---glycine ligase